MAAKWGKQGRRTTGGSTRASADEPARISNKLDRVLVAESKPQPGLRLKAAVRKVRSHRRFKPAAIAFVVIVAVCTVIAYVASRQKTPAVVSDGPRCSYAVLEKAKPALDVNKVAELEPQAKAIEQIDGYDTDVNCLYVVLTYYINTSDGIKARELYNKLVAVYDPAEGYETVIRDVTKTQEELKGEVEFVEKEAARVEKIGPTGAPQ
jgi:hypothetical protein